MTLPPKVCSLRTAVFISGRGSNLQALMDKEGCNIRLVCSNKNKIQGVLKAKRSSLTTKIISPINFKDLESFLKEKHINKIILLGFMKLLPEAFVKTWKERIVNLHPSILPEYPGLDSIIRSHQEKANMGITLHVVTLEMDEGPIIVQSKVYAKGKMAPLGLQRAQWAISFREHYFVRRLEDKWC